MVCKMDKRRKRTEYLQLKEKRKFLARVAVFRPTFIFLVQHFSAWLLEVPFFPPLLS